MDNIDKIKCRNMSKFTNEFVDLIIELLLENGIKICRTWNETWIESWIEQRNWIYISFSLDLGYNVDGEMQFSIEMLDCVNHDSKFIGDRFMVLGDLDILVCNKSKAKKYKVCKCGDTFKLIYSFLDKYFKCHSNSKHSIDLNELKLELDMNGLSAT